MAESSTPYSWFNFLLVIMYNVNICKYYNFFQLMIITCCVKQRRETRRKNERKNGEFLCIIKLSSFSFNDFCVSVKVCLVSIFQSFCFIYNSIKNCIKSKSSKFSKRIVLKHKLSNVIIHYSDIFYRFVWVKNPHNNYTY